MISCDIGSGSRSWSWDPCTCLPWILWSWMGSFQVKSQTSGPNPFDFDEIYYRCCTQWVIITHKCLGPCDLWGKWERSWKVTTFYQPWGAVGQIAHSRIAIGSCNYRHSPDKLSSFIMRYDGILHLRLTLDISRTKLRIWYLKLLPSLLSAKITGKWGTYLT